MNCWGGKEEAAGQMCDDGTKRKFLFNIVLVRYINYQIQNFVAKSSLMTFSYSMYCVWVFLSSEKTEFYAGQRMWPLSHLSYPTILSSMGSDLKTTASMLNKTKNRIRSFLLRDTDHHCCGSGMFIPDPNFFHPGSELFPSRIRIKYFNPKKSFLSSQKYDPGCSSRIRILIFYPSRISDPVAKRHRIPDPEHCGSLIRSGSF
jgi:hypothetical protein